MICCSRLAVFTCTILVGATIACTASGCKFGRLTTAHLNHVDRLNDRATVTLDRLYCPATDLTRPGKTDWCQAVPRCVAKCTCKTLEGARDVPEPAFVVYPQPPEMQLELGEMGGAYRPVDGVELQQPGVDLLNPGRFEPRNSLDPDSNIGRPQDDFYEPGRRQQPRF